MFARAGAMMEPAALEALKATFGFVDGPIGTQFLAYVKSVFTWGSRHLGALLPQPVADVLGRAIGWTLFLVGTSTILSFSIGSIVGIFAAWYRGGRMDQHPLPTHPRDAGHPRGGLPARPLLFGVSLGWLPIGYAYPGPGSPPTLAGNTSEHPAARHHAGGHPGAGTGGWFPLITMRNNMINLLGGDTSPWPKARGLSSNRVIFSYGARSAVLPSVTALSMALGFVIGGSLITEGDLQLPRPGTDPLSGHPWPATTLIQGSCSSLDHHHAQLQLLADVLYVFLDPRLRTGGK